MMKKMIIFTFFVVVVFGKSFDKVGTTAGQFLKIGVGARAIGMGGAFVAIADDGSAAYWNPAGLSFAETFKSMFNHQEWFLDISQEYLAIQYPLNRSTIFGFSVTALTMNDKEITTVSEPDGTGLTYSVLDIAVSGSVARRLSDRLRYGATAKFIQSSAYREIAQTFAFDIGSILETDFYGMRIGMSLSNFGGEIKYSGTDLIEKADIDDQYDGNIESDADLRTESWPIPLMIRIGTALEIIGDPATAPFGSRTNTLLVAVDAEHPNDAREHVNVGLEYTLYNMIVFRGGYRFNYDLDRLTIGIGFNSRIPGFGKLEMGYSVQPMGPFGNMSQMSLQLLFN